MSEQSLRAAIMEALAGNPVVHADEIAVDIHDGDVTLRGTVGSPLQQAEAVQTASGVAGVRHVEDGLRVRLMDYEGRADADTEAAVLDALIADDEVHAGDVRVESRDGAVTLSGLVEVPSQRERAQRIAMGVPGVASVHNELKVWLAVSADDIAERVTDAIGAGAMVGADAITVIVRDSDVTLTGTVTTPDHHDAAIAAAANAPGVARVHDALTLRANAR